MVEAGETVIVRAHATDVDGDRLRYRWIPGPGSGTVQLVRSSVVEWQVGEDRDEKELHLVVSDGRGGHAMETLRLPVVSEVVFGGQVVATDGKRIESAVVSVNDEVTVTDNEGLFRLPISDANSPRFVLTIRKWGYGLISRTYDQSVRNGTWTMLPATVQSFDPRQAINAVDVQSQANCTGSLTSGIDWNNYPVQRIPRLTDTFGQLGGGTVPAEITQALDFIFGGTACSPGISISIPANALVDDAGNAPADNVEVSLSTVDLYAPDSMPGDFSVRTKDGVRWMQSYGAGGVNVQAGGRQYQLKDGQTATLTIPVDPNQLLVKGEIPKSIPLLLFDEETGEWEQRWEATLVDEGRAYVAEIDHFSQFNTDLIKSDQACLRFRGDSLVSVAGNPGEFELDAIIPLSGAAPIVRNWDVSSSTEAVDAADPNLHVIVNLPSDTWITLIPMRAEAGDLVPYGIFGGNSGLAQNPTDPNFPVHPYDACANEIPLTDTTGSIDIVVDATGRGDGPLPIHILTMTDAAGTDILPLAPDPDDEYLYALYDTGTRELEISNTTTNRIRGTVAESDADLVGINALTMVNVRLNGLNQQDPGTCDVPMDAPGTANGAQVEFGPIDTLDDNPDATLVGNAIVRELVAHIDYQQMITIPACAGLASPISGPSMDFYMPGNAAIPTADVELTMQRFGNLTSTSGATVGQSYWLRNVVFQEGDKAVADDPNATDPIDFRFDTGTTLTIINDRVAGLLELPAGNGAFNCFGGAGNGYNIDAITMIGADGIYRVENVDVCWQQGAIAGASIVDAVLGSNFFDQVQIIIDGPNNTLGIIE